MIVFLDVMLPRLRCVRTVVCKPAGFAMRLADEAASASGSLQLSQTLCLSLYKLACVTGARRMASRALPVARHAAWVASR
jgi:hypothetical protein